MAKNIAFLLLAGHGERFHSSTPKQYLVMGPYPLFIYAARALDESPLISEIVFVYPHGYLETTQKLVQQYIKKPSLFVEGGESRQESCLRGLEALEKETLDADTLALVCDGDRPNLEARLIVENLKCAQEFGSAVTAIPSSDSVAIVKETGVIDGYLPRQEVYLLQTPQCFNYHTLLKVEKQAQKDNLAYTDEGALYMAITKKPLHYVLGSKANLKITDSEDAKILMGLSHD